MDFITGRIRLVKCQLTITGYCKNGPKYYYADSIKVDSQEKSMWYIDELELKQRLIMWQ